MQKGVAAMPNVLVEKSKALALQTIRAAHSLNEMKEFELKGQLLRSGTSVGANINEAVSGQSRKDFISKLEIALKECREALYWYEILDESGIYSNKEAISLCDEIIRMLVSSVKTAKSKDF